MARKTIDKRKIPAVLAECRDANHPTAIALEGGDARRRLDAETAEMILLKVASGMTQKEAALSFGLNPGTVAQRRIDDPAGFGARLKEAKEMGSDTLADSVLEYALRTDLPPRDREIIIDALKWTAKMANRGVYGDKVAVDAVHSIAPVMLPSYALPSVPIEEGDYVEISGSECREADAQDDNDL